MCYTAAADTLSHKDVLSICKKTCIKAMNGKCISRGYRDCNLVSAIIKKESGYDTEAYNPEVTGSYGLMQIQCATAKRMGLKYSCEQLFNPAINIRFGILYLINLEKKLGEYVVSDVLSAYNAGLKKKIIDGYKIYLPIRCKRYRKFQWHGSPQVICYPGEYINEEYVWYTRRYYDYISKH